MIQKMHHEIDITTEDDIDLRDLKNMFLLVKQGEFELKLPIMVDSKSKGFAVIHKSDAMKLKNGSCRIQIVFEEADGEPNYTDIGYCCIDELINKEGYGHE